MRPTLLLLLLTTSCFPGPLPQTDAADSAATETSATTDSSIADSATPDTNLDDSTSTTTDASTTSVVDVDADTGPQCPAVCTPIDECHEAGVCNPATGQCTTPAAENGKACDDGDLCTLGDECAGGFCVGPNRPPLQDWVANITTDGEALATVVAPSGQGGAFAFVSMEGTEVLVNFNPVFEADSDVLTCGLYLLDLQTDGKPNRFTPITSSTTCDTGGDVVARGAKVLADDSFYLSGTFASPFETTTGGVTIGTSPNGLILGRGHFLARFDQALTPLWALSFLGFRETAYDDVGVPTMSVNARNDIAFIINSNGNGATREIVDADGSSEVLEVPNRNSLSWIFEISPLGTRSELARVVGDDESEVVFSSVALLDDGASVIAGFSVGQRTELITSKESVFIPTLSGSNDFFDAWLAGIGPDGDIRWWRHFFVPPGAGVPHQERYVFAQQIAADADHTWVALTSVRFITTRTDEGPGDLLGATEPGLHPSSTTVVRLSTATGELEDSYVLGTAQTTVIRFIADRRGAIAIGRSAGLQIADDLVAAGGVARPFFARDHVWATQYASESNAGSPTTPILVDGLEFYEPFAASDGTGGYLVSGFLTATAVLGMNAMFTGYGTVEQPGNYVARLGSNGYLDCR